MQTIYKLQADFLKALAHPTRLRILDILRGQAPLCVCHIIEDLQLDQSNVSQHLRILRTAGIVSSSKEGKKVYYHTSFPMVYDLIDTLIPLLKTQISAISVALEKGGSHD